LSPEPKRRTYDAAAGAVRTAYDEPPEKLVRFAKDAGRSDTARLYPLWLWAHVTNDLAPLRSDWPTWRDRVKAEPEKDEIDFGNARLAGLIAACRIARDVSDNYAVIQLQPRTRQALRDRLVYELAHTEGGLVTMNGNRAVFGRWRNLTPEVARLLRLYAKDVHARLMDVYVDHHRPTWWLAWNVETLWGNEVPTALPTEAQEVFAARAMVLGEDAGKLAKFVDRPWCRADEFYIQKLALVLHATAGTEW